jgi:carbon storage regulator
MLVLSRKVGEEIVIGNDIRIKVIAIDGEKVRIGISAPKEVIVDRQEVHDKRLEWAGVHNLPTETMIGAF